VLANGRLLLSQDKAGELWLNLETDDGRLLQGRVVSSDGDLSTARQDLFCQFFAVWGMSDVTLNITR
jgi:hypothetical protein